MVSIVKRSIVVKRSYISNYLGYACTECGEFLDADKLLACVRYEDEVFKRVEANPNYYASESGKILSLQGKEPKVLKTQVINVNIKGNSKAVGIRLTAGGKIAMRSVPRLIYSTFRGTPKGRVKSLDGNPSNIRLDNLYDSFNGK